MARDDEIVETDDYICYKFLTKSCNNRVRLVGNENGVWTRKHFRSHVRRVLNIIEENEFRESNIIRTNDTSQVGTEITAATLAITVLFIKVKINRVDSL
jgi:hypothetical protein